MRCNGHQYISASCVSFIRNVMYSMRFSILPLCHFYNSTPGMTTVRVNDGVDGSATMASKFIWLIVAVIH